LEALTIERAHIISGQLEASGDDDSAGCGEVEGFLKLVIQIPCYNEADTLPLVVHDMPRQVEGFEAVELLVIDDGSTDATAEIATELGVHHVVKLPQNRGLANAFAKGLEVSLALGADVIVNTDGDNQYDNSEIPELVWPILTGQADMVIGDRRVDTIAHFSPIKKLLQKFGSWVVRWASNTGVPDATSGFRAISRDTALRLHVFSSYTYTLETIIQAGRKGLTVASVPVRTRERLRESRLIRSLPSYIYLSALTILRIFMMYEPLRVFISLGILPFVAGGLLVVRFLYFYLSGDGSGHVQSLIVASILLVLGLQTFFLGLLADIIAKNRNLIEETHYRIKKIQLNERHKN
jgi:glycosyltransferase involved in cell wall biosynthesis